jgi:hypothetical protein
VVLYEDAARKRLGALLACLRGARAVAAAASAFDACRDELRSEHLRALVTEGSAPEDAAADDDDDDADADDAMDADADVAPAAPPRAHCFAGLPAITAALAPFEAAFDWDAAEKCGRVEVRPGADAAVDAAAASAAAAERALREWLLEQRAVLKASDKEARCGAAFVCVFLSRTFRAVCTN